MGDITKWKIFSHMPFLLFNQIQKKGFSGMEMQMQYSAFVCLFVFKNFYISYSSLLGTI